MQMDAYLEKEQIDTFFVWVGAPEGGFWGGGKGDPAHTCLPSKISFLLLIKIRISLIFARAFPRQLAPAALL